MRWRVYDGCCRDAQSDDEHQMAPEAEMEAVAVARKLVRRCWRRDCNDA
jgi:hypothetical protein